MNKYIRIAISFILLVITAVLGTSCEKQLNLEPISDISAGVFYNNANDIDLAVVSTYNSLYGVMNKEFVVTELRSDNTYMSPQNSETSNVPYRAADRFVLNSQNIYVQEYWRALYRTVSLSNNVIAHIDVVENEELAGQYLGEARFLRAHAYFNLVRSYGGVFIIDEPITGQDAKKRDRSTVEDVYKFLIADLEYAAENLPDVSSGAQLGRVTKWAAKALLGKALLTRNTGSDNDDAITVLTEVVNLSGFSMLPSYADVFSISNEHNSEILFAVRYQSGGVGLGAPFANYFSPIQSDNFVVTGSGDELNVPTTSMSAAYEAADQRKAVSMADSFLLGSSYVQARFISKYNSTFSNVDDAGNDWPIIRFTDVMLLLAEAINNQGGPTPQAIDLLNDVRQRAGLTAYTTAEVGSYFDFKLALELERKLEFAFENQRWFDLVRTERAITVMNTHFSTEDQYNDPTRPQFYTSPISSWQLLLPIPQYEIDLNPSIAQNIGY